MSKSLQVSSTKEITQLSDFKPQKFIQIFPKQQKKYVFIKIAILVSLFFLMVGCAGSQSASISVNLAHNQQILAEESILWPLEHAETVKPTPGPTPVINNIPASTDSVNLLPTSTAASEVVGLSTGVPLLTSPTQSQIEHIVIISIDGLRPDALNVANTPNIDELRDKGAYSPKAQTVSLSITLPSHASMLTGMIPDKHGIIWGLPYIGWPGMAGPSLLSEAHDAGFSTAMSFGKEKLNYLCLENSVDYLFGEDVHDLEVKEHAIEFIQAGLPNVLFIHFPDVDRVGHDYGWMSTNQLYSIAYTDGLIGEIVAEIEAGGYLDSTMFIVSADHGGHGKGHGDDSSLDRTIPWLAVGPGIQSGVILSSQINTYDTAATAMYALNLPIPEKWDGQPVLEIFE